MQSVTNSGLKLKILEHYKREIIQTYGFQHILSLTNLENAGLIKLQVTVHCIHNTKSDACWDLKVLFFVVHW
jgi:hypothetical protein